VISDYAVLPTTGLLHGTSGALLCAPKSIVIPVPPLRHLAQSSDTLSLRYREWRTLQYRCPHMPSFSPPRSISLAPSPLRQSSWTLSPLGSMWTTLRFVILDRRSILTIPVLPYPLERRASLTTKDRMRMNALCATVFPPLFPRPTLTVPRNNFSLTTMANRYLMNPQTLQFFATRRHMLQSEPPVHLLRSYPMGFSNLPWTNFVN
jgi:hypothetical protein